jgi:hypothetical protein
MLPYASAQEPKIRLGLSSSSYVVCARVQVVQVVQVALAVYSGRKPTLASDAESNNRCTGSTGCV